MPGLLKIGYTNRSVGERIQELSSTGVPGKFINELSIETDDAYSFEKAVHSTLSKYRYDKEFFQIDIQVTIQILMTITSEVGIHVVNLSGHHAHLCSKVSYKSENLKVISEKTIKLFNYQKRLSLLSYEELKKLYFEEASSHEMRLIEPYYKKARDKFLEEKDIKRHQAYEKFKSIEKGYLEVTQSIVKVIENQLILRRFQKYFVKSSMRDGVRIYQNSNMEDKKLFHIFTAIWLCLDRFNHLTIYDLRQGATLAGNCVIYSSSQSLEFSDLMKGIIQLIEDGDETNRYKILIEKEMA